MDSFGKHIKYHHIQCFILYPISKARFCYPYDNGILTNLFVDLDSFPIQRKYIVILQTNAYIYSFLENVTYAMYRDHKNLRGILECHNLRNLGW